MSRSNSTQDRQGGHPGHAGGQPASQARGVFSRQGQIPEPGSSLPWQQQEPVLPGPHSLQPDHSHAYYQQDPNGYPPAHPAPGQGYYPPDAYAPQAGAQQAPEAYYGHYFQAGQQTAPQAYGQPQYPQAQQPPAPQSTPQGHYPPQHPQQGFGGQPQSYADPRTGYDLGGYATQPAQPPAPYYAPQGQPQAGYPGAGLNHGYAQPQQGYDTSHDDLEHEPDQDQEYDDEAHDAPRSRFRGLMVVGSLIGAIALGAGLAYGYKKFGGGLNVGKPPILKADAGNTKARVDAPQAKKVAARLDGPVPQVVPAQQTDAGAGGTRMVQTIPVLPNGTMVAPPAAPTAPATPLRPTISVPGMAVDNLPLARVSAPPPQQIAAQSAPIPVVTPAPQGRPVAPPPTTVIARAEPAPTPVPAARQPVAKASAASAVAAAPTGSTAAPAPRASNGYVAVLSSQGTRIDALKAYADLQQKYGTVLASKPADVQEATVNGKVWYRAVVGPPGSRGAAADLCAQLKTAGHSACFPAAY